MLARTDPARPPGAVGQPASRWWPRASSLAVRSIQQQHDAPTLYRELLDAGREGHHHDAWWTDDLDALLDRAAAAGWRTTMSGDGGGMTRFGYPGRPGCPDEVIEVMELTATNGPFTDAIRVAAVDWDGAEPVR